MLDMKFKVNKSLVMHGLKLRGLAQDENEANKEGLNQIVHSKNFLTNDYL